MSIISFSGTKIEYKYSNEEELTGASKNGKNIFRKTLEIEVSSAGNLIFNHNIGIDEYINVYGTCYVYNQKENIRPIPYYDGSGRIWVTNIFKDSVYIYSAWPQSKVWLTVEYTKYE